MPAYNEVRRSLTRHRTSGCIPVPDPLSIPVELQVTMRGRELATTDANYGERFQLLHSGQDGRLLVFGAATELEVLHGSEYVICDGTFEMSPSTAYQVYTIHGYCHGEGMPLCWALLPNKTASTYTEMFQVIRAALVQRSGSVGAMKTFITDFELAAIKAIRTVFPDAVIRGCSFHFRQALMRRIQHEGLKCVCFPSASRLGNVSPAYGCLSLRCRLLGWCQLRPQSDLVM